MDELPVMASTLTPASPDQDGAKVREARSRKGAKEAPEAEPEVTGPVVIKRVDHV